MNFVTVAFRLTLMVMTMTAAGASHGQAFVPPTYKASPLEVAKLPLYCHQQYVNGALGGPKFSIPNAMCGGEMNHFCPALVFLMQVEQESLRKSERGGALRHAIKEIDYTIRGMKPGCYLEPEVLRAKRKAELLKTIFGSTLK